jgi:Na+/H+ antiporter NhaD/arsenite permease-like protein
VIATVVEGIPYWTATPFALLLLSIAILPLVRSHWWHDHWNKAKVSVAFGLPSLLIALFYDRTAIAHTAVEYLAFISLLGSLFTISGGVRVRGSTAGTPLANTGLLGAVLANLVGTTGAAMLLIHPFLRANRRRKSRVHLVIFFVFIVANCGGCLTPLGDPPLFLGFLKGVPFAWTLGLWKPWAVLVGALLVMFHRYDRHRFRREGVVVPQDLDEIAEDQRPIRLEGSFNLLLLLAVVGTVLTCGSFIHPRFGETTALVCQSLILAALAVISLKSTPRRLREQNDFSWHPFVEVTVIFAGIFATMIPALAVLRAHGPSLGVTAPWQYFWAAGSLSAFLDNAPTYLAFLAMAQHLPDEVAGTTHAVLAAIACGSVFFGAMTYIGNGPNFLVRAIAEHHGIRMPTLFGYMAWSLSILGPLLVGITLLFFR